MDSVLEIKNVTKYYQKFKALDNLNLNLNKAEILGFLGPNGSGKTTTIRIILNLIRATSGQIKIFGIDSTKTNLVHQYIGYVPSEPSFWPNLTVKETLHFLASLHHNYDYSYEEELIKLFDLDLNKKIRQLSRGNKQKVAIVSALSTRAKLLVLDEPSTGLDPLMENKFREEIIKAKQNDQTVFFSSHILDEVEAVADQVAILKNGHIIEFGNLEKLKEFRATKIEAILKSSKDTPQFKNIKGISNLRIENKHLSLLVHGDESLVFKEIMNLKPIKIYASPTSLEDLFLSYYKDK